jgi:hypothetical protein
MRPLVSALVLVLSLSGSAFADASAPSPLAQARINAAAETYRIIETMFHSGMEKADSVYLWSVRWYTASHEAGVTTAAADHLKRMQTLEGEVKNKVSAGIAPASDTLAAKYYVAEAQLWAGGKPR